MIPLKDALLALRNATPQELLDALESEHRTHQQLIVKNIVAMFRAYATAPHDDRNHDSIRFCQSLNHCINDDLIPAYFSHI